MAIGNVDLYKALKEAGVSDDAPADAAKSVASHLPRFWALTGTLVLLTALTLGLVWLQVQTVQRLATLEERFTAFEQRVTDQLSQVVQQLELMTREHSAADREDARGSALGESAEP
jgi:predicted PurR-regulated permease PerM